MWRKTLLACVVCPVLVISAASHYASIVSKFNGIEKHRYKPGSRVTIPSAELNAYVQTELPKVAPPGIRDPQVELLGENLATGRAKINFLTLRNAQGKPAGWLLKKLLDGERDVAVTTEVVSGNGSAVVNIKRVEISGIPIEGPALDFVIRNYLIPNYPNAKIGRPFQLRYGMDRFDVKRDTVDVVMATRR